MVVALIALFVTLGGSAYAASTGLISSGASPTLAQCRADVYGAFRFKPSGTAAQRAAATQAICGDLATSGASGATGAQGPKGDSGATGATGATGAAAYAEFFALMPPDNAATVAPGTAVQFPQDGPQAGDVSRTGASTFNIATPGTYRVAFSVSVTEAGQLAVALNGLELPYTVSGRATGTSQISGEALVTTVVPNSLISIVNPVGNSTALTITPLAGGTHPVGASLIVQQLG